MEVLVNDSQLKLYRDLVFLYDNKFLQHPINFQMHWLGLYVIRFVTEESGVQLEKLNGEIMEGLVNDSQLKLYRDSRPSLHYHDCTIHVL
jgi:hypothetical protein